MVETVINQNDGFLSITAVGGETDLDGDFPIYEKSHVRIIRTRSGTDTDLVLNTDYTIADNQLEVTAGFTAVLAGSATPASAGDVYTLLLNVPEARTADFNQAGDFLAATLNEELDLQTQMIQQLRRDVDKSAKLPDTSTITTVTLPDPVDGRVIAWDGVSGEMQNLLIADAGNLSVSAFIETLLDDSTAAAARTTLGIPFTAASSSTAAALVLAEDTDNGVNTVTVIAPASVASDKIMTLPDATDTFVGKATTDTLTNKTIATGGGNDVQHQFKVVTTTYDVSTASGTQDITGFGFNPRGCDILMGQSGGGLFFSDGFADSAAQGCRYQNDAALLQITTGITVFAQSVIGTTQASGVVSFITDGIRITWTKVGSPTGTITMLIKGYR